MKIDKIELFHVAMPLIYPWRTAYGEDKAVHSVLCRLSSGSLDGWGESTPLAAPCYSPEWGAGVFATARDWLAPAIIQKDIESGEQLQKMLVVYKGNPFAKSVLDTAWWSLFCKLQNTPLHETLGATRCEVPVGADFGVMDDLDQLLTSVGEAVENRFARIKLKFRPGWGYEVVEAVRKQHPAHPIHIDCNSGYTLADFELFRRLDQFELKMIEQPLQHDDLIDHAKLQSEIETPICLDESIVSVHRTRQAIAQNCCQYVNVKPGRVGGLTNAVKIHNLCQEAGIPCWVGGMLESAVGASQCAALAMLDNFTYPADIFPSSRFYREDLADPPLELHSSADGMPSVVAPQVLSEPVSRRLEKCFLQRAVIK